MMSRFARWQLIAFAILTVLGVTYVSLAYVGVPAMLGVGRHQVTVEMPRTGNLYPDARVTLKGVTIGKVSEMKLASNGVQARLSIDNEHRIPNASRVEVRSVSAVGERYINFEPQESTSSVLGEGDVVPASQVRLPIEIGPLLGKANRLAATVPTDDLNTTIDELDKAFSGTSDDLQRLLDSGGLLLKGAEANLGSLRKLISDLEPVLATQQRTAGHVRSFSGDLRAFTDQLRASDKAMRGAIEKTPPLLRESDRLVNQLRTPLPGLLANLTAVGDVAKVYLPNVAHVLTVLPTPLNGLQNSIQQSPVPGTALLNFKTTVNEPPPCTKGFLAKHRPPSDLSPARPAANASCKEPPDSPIGVRGGRNSPCPNDPARRSADARGCGLHFQSPEESRKSQEEAIQTMLDVARTQPTSRPRPDTAKKKPAEVNGTEIPTPYDQGTGFFVGPDGRSYLLGDATSTPETSDWRSLLLAPMGLQTPP